MRVCFISRRFFPTISGMSVYALNLLRQLVALGHDVTMISQYYGGVAAGVYGGGPPPEVPGVRVIGVESVNEQSNGNFEADIAEIVRIVEREHALRPFDIVHAQYGYPTGLAGLIAARRLGVPSVVSIQGGDGHWVGECCTTHKRAMRQVCDGADALLIGSTSFAGEVRGRLGTDASRFTIVPGAVDTDRFTPSPDHAPGQLGRPPVLLYHGRVDRRKGALDLLEAFDQLTAAGRPLRLIVSGIGPDLEAVRRRAATLVGVEVTGYAEYAATPDVYRRGDVFVSPTYAEGFSNTILEAMASGLPIVSCDAVGVVDCLRHEENGLLARVADIDDLTAQIARMLDDDALRLQLASAALAECRSTYSWTAIGRQIGSIYAHVASHPTETDQALPAWSDEPCRYRSQPHLL